MNVNINRMRYVFVVLILIVLISCRTSKLDPNSEKVAVLGEDYTIEKYKAKKNNTYLTFEVFAGEAKVPAKYLYLNIKGIYRGTFPNSNIATFEVKKNRKYNVKIGVPSFKLINIYSISLQERDSIVIRAHLTDISAVILH